MIDPESLNPLEVLTHLKQLGYDNITTPQLNDFMHDLRKLIRYEQKYTRGVHSTSDSTLPQSMSRDRDSRSTSSMTSSSDASQLCTDCIDCKTDSSSGRTDVTSLTEAVCKKKKQSSVCPQTSRPHSSFIRPWRLQQSGKAAMTVTNLKSDPVHLYHKYKDLWTAQKVPGEKSHSQLRWTIREKMLGQDPHPRPVSQASADYRSRSTCHKQ